MIQKAIKLKNIGRDIAGSRLLRDDDKTEFGWWDTKRKQAYLCASYEYLDRLMLRLDEKGITYSVVDCSGRMDTDMAGASESLYGEPKRRP